MKIQPNMMTWTWAGWEPAQFYRRLGGFHEAQEGNALWSDDWFRRLESEDTAKALAEAGINWVTTHFYKGFGLEAEAEEIAGTARLIANYHRHGVKVFTYIQYGTVMPETIQEENEASRNWGRVDWNGQHDGHPYEYGDQYWRAKPCANQPGFREHLLRCVDKALEIGADGIWIDNLQADGCHCPRCQEVFRTYVQANVKDPWQDLGLRPVQLAGITIPRAVRPRDPLFQLWIRCRVEEVRTSLEMICARARSLKPDVVMAANIGIGNHQKHVLENANWHSMLELLDFTYAENGLFPAWTGEKIVSQQYTYSIANAVGSRIVPGAGVGAGSRGLPRNRLPGERELRRCLAESAMFGGHALGGPWGLRGENGGEAPILLRDASWRQLNRRFTDFYRAKWPLFGAAVDASPVAMLYNFESLLADEPTYRRAYEAMAQALMQHQIPFRYVLSDRLEKLDDVKVLVLPHVLPLAEQTETAIRAWVKRGGRILATGRCGLYDHWMRQRTDYALADLFGVHFSNAFEDTHHDAIIRNLETGCVLLPGQWGQMLGENQPACRIPADRVAPEIRALLPAGLPEVISPVPQVGCAWQRLPDGTYLLSLLNYGDEPVRGLEIRWLAGDQAPTQVKAFDASGVTCELPVLKLGGGFVGVCPLSLDVELFLQSKKWTERNSYEAQT
jgi:hypothetical protein